MASAPSNKIERAHQMYREGRYEDALGLYTEALAIAKTNPQKIALHSNRAACFLKLHRFNKAAEECTSVLELDQNHTGALMLRAQTLVTLKEYHSALFDVNRLIELNPSSEVYQNLEARLRTQLSLAPIPESEAELEEEDEEQEQEQENENDDVGAETIIDEVKEEQYKEREIMTIASTRTVNSAEFNRTVAKINFTGIKIPIEEALSEHENGQSINSVKIKPTAEAVAPPHQAQHTKVNSAELNGTIAKTNFTGIKIPIKKALSEQENGQSANSVKNKPTAEAVAPPQAQHTKVNGAAFNRTIAKTNFTGIKIPIKKALSEQENGQSVNSVQNKPTAEAVTPPQAQHTKGLSEKDPKGWQSIPKPKGHTALDYARWDRVEDDSSEDEDDDDDEEAQPQYRFRLKTVGVRPVK